MSAAAYYYGLGSAGAYPVLDAYLASRERVSLIDGPLGSGKTTASCQRFVMHMAEQEPNAQGIRPTRFLVVRNNYPELLETTAETFRDFFFPDDGEPPVDADGTPQPPRLPLGRWYGGGEEPPQAVFDFNLEDGTRVKSTVVFMALDRPKDVKRILGSEYTWIYLSEFKELEKSIIDMLDLRHGRYPSEGRGAVAATHSGLFGDTNRPDREHWYYRASQEEKPKGWAFFHQPGGLRVVGTRPDGRRIFEANPAAENLKNLRGGSDYYLAGMAGKRDDWILVYLCNEFGMVQEGKPVHPDFVESIHAVPEALEADRRLPLVLGFDFGRTPACVVLQWSPGIGRWLVLGEFVTSDMSASAFAPECRAWLNRTFPGFAMRGFGDPAGDRAGQTVEETPIKILRANGIPCEPAPTNVAALRRAALANPLRRGTMDGRRAFLISSTACPVTVAGLAGKWCFERVNKVGVEEYREEPAKNRWSHPCEALEYALAGGGEAAAAIETPEQRRVRELGAGLREQEVAEM